MNNRSEMMSPLVVDLDKTLLRVDSLHEQLVDLLFRKPMQFVAALWHLPRGRAAFKRYVSDVSEPFVVSDAVVNAELLAFVKAQRDRGRDVHLFTAADTRIAQSVANTLGVFDSAVGSDGKNLKGTAKRDRIKELFPGGFTYAGDGIHDLPIWAAADSVALIAVDSKTRAKVNQLGKAIEFETSRTRASLWDWVRLLRVHQWSKNVLVAIPLLLSHQFGSLSSIAQAVLAFVAISLVASAGYIVNDVADRAADRAHPTKSERPIAKGQIDPIRALGVAIFLAVSGLAIAGAVSMTGALILVGYAVGTLFYTTIFKKQVLADVFALAGLYTVRIVFGAAAVQVELSHWLFAFSLLLFFSLSLAKRHSELVKASMPGGDMGRLLGRGYRPDDAVLLLTLGVSSTMCAVLLLSLYVATDAYTYTGYRGPGFLWGAVMSVFAWTTRIWLKSHRGELDSDPVVFALKDQVSQMIAIVSVAFFFLSVI